MDFIQNLSVQKSKQTSKIDIQYCLETCAIYVGTKYDVDASGERIRCLLSYNIFGFLFFPSSWLPKRQFISMIMQDTKKINDCSKKAKNEK